MVRERRQRASFRPANPHFDTRTVLLVLAGTLAAAILAAVVAPAASSIATTAAVPLQTTTAAAAAVPALTPDEVNLSLRPAGRPVGAYVSLTMRPGQTRTVDVVLTNNGQRRLAALAYTASAITVRDGGFGAADAGQRRTGAARWIRPAERHLTLGGYTSRTLRLTIRVPALARPGSHSAAFVAQNADVAVPVGEAPELGQILRQVMAVVIRVPGPTSGTVEANSAELFDNGGIRQVRVNATNTGTRNVEPNVRLRLTDSDGTLVADRSYQMGLFLPDTSTDLILPLESELEGGTYQAAVELTGGGLSGSYTNENLYVIIPSGTPAATPKSSRVPMLAAAAAGVALLVVAWLIWRRRQRRRRRRHGSGSPQSGLPVPSTGLRSFTAAQAAAVLKDELIELRGNPSIALTAHQARPGSTLRSVVAIPAVDVSPTAAVLPPEVGLVLTAPTVDDAVDRWWSQVPDHHHVALIITADPVAARATVIAHLG